MRDEYLLWTVTTSFHSLLHVTIFYAKTEIFLGQIEETQYIYFYYSSLITMSYSKDEGHSYLDFDDNISSFHQIGNK